MINLHTLRLISVLTLGVGLAARSDETKPNIILIVADDLGAVDLGCYGSKFHKTPNLDRMAESSRKFTTAYAACPVCSPTRASLMTGKHPARLHLTDWLPGRGDFKAHKLARPAFLQQLPLEEVTIAEVLKKSGYATAIIGKWHLGGEGFGPTRQGFDLNIAGDDTGTARSYWAPFARQGRVMPGLETAPEGEYLTDRLAAEAEAFIESNRTRPFFLYLPHYAVHTPMTAKPDLIAKFAAWDGLPHGKQENPIYAAMLASLDEAVGRVLDKLDATGLASQTIVIFTSDNGGLATREGANTPATNNAPLREGKGWVYEGGIRVPLLIRWPNKIEPGPDPTPTWSADLFPTLLNLAGIHDHSPVDGQSLAALLTEHKSLPARALYWHYPHYANQGSQPSAAIREGDWKLVINDVSNRRELYNLARDPSESTNLADKEPEQLAALDAKLANWRTEAKVQMPTENPAYRPNPEDKAGLVTLAASTAEVHGVMLRYEPLAHKNTLGYWVRLDDWASWEFEVDQPGQFEVVALVGCGKGSGGSQVEFEIDGQILKQTVPVTGGFQAFEPQALGKVTLNRPGRQHLSVHARSKPGPAVMDLRQVTLKRISKP